jgi:integrase
VNTILGDLDKALAGYDAAEPLLPADHLQWLYGDRSGVKERLGDTAGATADRHGALQLREHQGALSRGAQAPKSRVLETIARATHAGIAKIPGARSEGPRAGNWLTRDQASRLLALPDPGTSKGKRDRAIVGLLLGCGLRRDELVRLTIEEIQQREGRWVIVDILGKGRRRRTIPVPSWVKVSIDDWMAAAGVTDGCVFRAIKKGGRVYGDGLTANIVWSIVRGYAAEIGVPKLAPHDLRRTCAKLCRAAGGDLEQIQLLLGHASIATTERYLGSRLDLTNAVNDDLGLDVVGLTRS